MFCPSCGTENSIGLPYCNRCGANLNLNLAPQPEPVMVNITRPTLIIGMVMLFLTLGGFAGLIRGVLRLAPVLQGNDPLIAVIVLGMLTILTVDIFLALLLSKLIGASLASGTQMQAGQPRTLAANPPAQLYQQPQQSRLQGVPSVTEHTTRFFEPAPRSSSPPDERAAAEKLDR
jgi:hypothetical protein